jgi:RNA polymerase sigma factor (sigma-70 family)
MFQNALQSIRSGDMSSFASLYDLSCDRVYRSIFHRVLDTALTEDIMSQVYMKALKTIKNFRGTSEWEFFAWILKIAYHTTIDELRGYTYDIPLEDIEFEWVYHETEYSNLDNKSRLEEVLGFLSTISERDRMILTYRIWDDLSYKEISDITGESVSNCKKIVSRTLEKLSANIVGIISLTLLLNYVIHR